MIDLYRLPRDFPGYDPCSAQRDPFERVSCLQRALAEDFADDRFIPFILVHEFEALLFTDLEHFDSEFVEHGDAIESLHRATSRFETPEHIDGGPTTAPSKRIMREIPEYRRRKSSAGPNIAEKIGLARIREKCRHFHGWIDQLEALSADGHVA